MINNRRFKTKKRKKVLTNRQKKVFMRNALFGLLGIGVVTGGVSVAINLAANPSAVYLESESGSSDFSWYMKPSYTSNNGYEVRTFNLYANSSCVMKVTPGMTNYDGVVGNDGLVFFSDIKKDGYESVPCSKSMSVILTEPNNKANDTFNVVVDTENPTCGNVELVKSKDGWYYNVASVNDDSGVKTSGFLTQSGLTASEVLTQLDSSNTGTRLNLSETNTPEHYYFYVVDYVNNVCEKDCGKLPYVDWTAPSTDADIVGGREIDSVHYYGSADLGSCYEAAVTDNLSDVVSLTQLSDNEKGSLSFINGEITGSTYKVNLAGVSDGTYSIGYKADDNRGNTTVIKKENKIVVDTKTPVISSLTINADTPIPMTESNGTFTSTGETTFNQSNLSLSCEVLEANIDDFSASIGGKSLPIKKINLTEEITAYNIPLTLEMIPSDKVLITITDKCGNTAYYNVTGLNIDTLAPAVVDMSANDLDILSTANNNFSSSINFEIGIEETSLDKDSIKVIFEALNTDGTILSTSEISEINVSSSGNKHAITFSQKDIEDGYYKIYIKGADNSGNLFEKESKQFSVDGTAPVIKVTTVDGKTHVPNDNSKAVSKVVTFDSTDLNHDHQNMIDFKIINKDNFGQTIEPIKCVINGNKDYEGSLEGLVAVVNNIENWTQKDITYTCSIEFLTEGNYSLTDICAGDVAGNHSEKISTKFTIDGTAPSVDEIRFDVDQNHHEDYQYISNTPITVSILAIDQVSELKELKANYTVNGITKKITFEKTSEGEFQYIFGKTEGIKGKINNITVSDTYDNQSTKTLDNGIIVDTETEDVELLNLQIKDNTNNSNKNVYNHDIDLSFKGEDNYSGLKKIGYTINGKGKEEDYSDSKKLVYKYSNHSKLTAIPENEGDNIQVELKAEDNAGNVKVISKEYSIDVTEPVIDVSYDVTESNSYYKNNRTAIISVREKHFSPQNTVFTVNKNGESVPVKLAFSTKDNINYTASYTFSEDGDYTFKVTSTDEAGNEGMLEMNEQFTIDKTAPSVKISFDNNAASNSNYFSSSRTATITVNEHNFNESLVTIESSAALNGTTIPNPEVSKFSNDGDVHTATISYSKDGDYTLSVFVTDQAGNKSETQKVNTFTIDLTKPSIQIINIEDGSSYNDVVEPVIKIEDSNYDTSSISIVLTGNKTGKHSELSYSTTDSAGGGTYAFKDFEHVSEIDDCYVLSATGKDLAGNSVSEQVSFKVNRFGSLYSLDKYTKKAIDDYYTSAEEDFVINEENVDEIVDRDIYYSKDGDIVYLSENEGYTTKHDTDKNNWNRYNYRIKTDGITEDGIYTFTLYSKDQSGNEMSTKTQNVDFTVCVDKTAPSVVITGLDKDQVYQGEEQTVTVNVTDNIALDYAVITLNGKEKKYAAKDIIDDTITVKIPEKASTQTFSVQAVDMAGNSFDTGESMKFTVSSNKIITSFHHHKAIYICVGIVSLIIFIGCCFLFIRQFKKKKQIEE